MLAYALQGITIGFSAGVTPGPLMAYFLSQTLKNGWKRTLPAAMAPLISDGPIILLVLLLLTRTPDWLLNSLRILGGGFILYLAWKSLPLLRDVQSIGQLTEEKPTSLRDAVTMNLLNPNPYLYWGTILGPILLEGWRRFPSWGLGFMAGFYGTMITCFMGLIFLFSAARQLGPGVVRALGFVAAVAMLGFGLFQIFSGAVGLFTN
jgi:threonine/homoserine/homoserine lactone efflux protein